MSYTRAYELFPARINIRCDADGCDEEVETDATRVNDARRAVHAIGWSSRRAHSILSDYCPEHETA